MFANCEDSSCPPMPTSLPSLRLPALQATQNKVRRRLRRPPRPDRIKGLFGKPAVTWTATIVQLARITDADPLDAPMRSVQRGKTPSQRCQRWNARSDDGEWRCGARLWPAWVCWATGVPCFLCASGDWRTCAAMCGAAAEGWRLRWGFNATVPPSWPGRGT